MMATGNHNKESLRTGGMVTTTPKERVRGEGK
jgi:hypothetical protein